MRTKVSLSLAGLLALTGCALQPVASTPASPPASAVPAPCTAPQGPQPRTDYCRYPQDVRAFLDDRDACDHFRGEPWPERDTDEDRERRKQLIDGVRTACAGTDKRLDELLDRYRSDTAIMQLLSQFERGIESP